ncbi:hypothetical protein JCM8097_005712 [Rhodosporidiobolus ruineniae]
MRFHCLGVGSIGSLFATNLASLPSAQVRLILRRHDNAAQILNSSRARDTDDKTPYGTLTVERNGIVRRITNLELELTRASNAIHESTTLSSRTRPPVRIDPRLWNRNDPIETLVVTTKAPQTLPAVQQLLPRLSSRSTIVLCHNGMGVLEGLLAKFWPEDRSDLIEAEYERRGGAGGRGSWNSTGGRPSFVCATTTHGAWRQSAGHFIHAGMGDVKFGVVPNRAVQSALSSYPSPSWPSPSDNPILNPRSTVQPTLDHLPYTPATASLHTTVSSLLSCHDLHPIWLPLPRLQIAQLQKLAVNASVNSLTAVVGVNNGALVGSQKAKRVIAAVTAECSGVFAAHLAREEGRWSPPSEDDVDDVDHPLSPSHFPPPLPNSHPLSASSLTDYTERVLIATSSNISSTLSDVLSASPSPSSSSSSSSSASALRAPSRNEIEYINGYVSSLGRQYGVPTPTVDALGDLVLLKEEMARVGAVDRVWEGRRRAVEAKAAPPAAREGAGKGQKGRPSRSSSSSGSSAASSPRSRSSSPTRPRSPADTKARAHERARAHEQLRREQEERMARRGVERAREEADRRGG